MRSSIVLSMGLGCLIAGLLSQTTYATIDPSQLAEQAVAEDLHEPTPDPDGRVQTLNQKGAMSPAIDPTSLAFVNVSTIKNAKVLEIGAGYGLTCLAALKKGAENYTANDMDARHIKILARKLQENYPQGLPHLKLDISEFPKDISNLDHDYDAILIARVLHFMKPEEADAAIKALHSLLKPGGKVYAVMLTPYVRGFAGFIPEFEKRIKDGSENPGFVQNLSAIADPNVVSEVARKKMEKPFLFFNRELAKTYFEKHGFIIENCEELPVAYPSKIWELDGRENVGAIAKKPS